MKSCENCRNNNLCGVAYSPFCVINERLNWQPDYPTLESQNAELINLLEKIKPSVCGLFCAPDEHDGICKEITRARARPGFRPAAKAG
jgi:hypothetical protein